MKVRKLCLLGRLFQSSPHSSCFTCFEGQDVLQQDFAAIVVNTYCSIGVHMSISKRFETLEKISRVQYFNLQAAWLFLPSSD
jgi:hypothetical protein